MSADDTYSPRAELVIKLFPDSLIQFRTELTKHPDLYQAAALEPTFESCIGIVAAKLNIALDGEYDADELLTMLTKAMMSRYMQNDPSAPPSNSEALGLKRVQLVETEGDVHVLPEDEREWQREFAHRKNKEGQEAPYTVCGECKTEFDCCSNRVCGKGKEVYQRGWPKPEGFLV